MAQLISFVFITLLINVALAKPPADNTYSIPPDEKNAEPNYVMQPRVSSNEYHLVPGPSITLAFSPVYDLDNEETSQWGGLHYSPWMDPTRRAQVGADLRAGTLWFHGALHFLQSRSRFRFYWGGGVSVRVNDEARLAPLSKKRNYYLMGTAGWEMQVTNQGSLRAEAGYHQGTDDQFLKGILGYTYHF